MLAVRNVAKSYGRYAAVRGVNFDLPRGTVVGLLGPNGAGKTTTIRMITGFFPPDRGEILVDGHHTVEQSTSARASIGYLPESAPLYTEMTVRDFLHFRGRLYSMPRPARIAAVDRCVERCWLASVQSRRIGQLSKGYRQRVGLAAALLHNPPLIVLDEPTNGLDPTQINETRRLVAELGQDHTLLISSHILPEVERVCQRVLIMIRGRIRADGTPADLTASSSGNAICTVETATPTTDDASRAQSAIDAGIRLISAATTQHEAQSPGRLLSRITVPQGVDPAESISRSLQTSGITITRLAIERPTLESVFLRLLETSDDAEAA